MFLVHPTRLSKIFADDQTHPCGNARHKQASKLVGYGAKSRMRSPKMRTFEKELPGRPYSAPAVARQSFVTIPYTRVIIFIPHRPPRKQAHTSGAVGPSK